MIRWPGRFPGALILLILCGLVWRVVLSYYVIPAWEGSRHLVPFPDDYPALARSLIETGTLGYGLPGGASPTTVRGPGFPLWLALGMITGGFDPRWLRLWSSVPVLILAPFVIVLMARRHGTIAAFAAGLILLFHPLPGKLSARIMSDEFFAVCGFAAILVWDAALRSARPRRTLLLALSTASLVAIQILTRSTGVLFLIVVAVLGLRAGRGYRALTVIVTVVALLPALVWSYRSSSLEGRFVFVHSLKGYNFWMGEGFDRYGYGWMDHETWPKIVELIDSTAGLPPVEYSRKLDYTKLTPTETASLEINLQRAAVERVVTDPWGYAGRVARGFCRFWFEADTARIRLFNAVAVLPLLGLAIVAMVRLSRGTLQPDRILVASILLVVLHNLLYAGVLPLARFSAHVYPGLAWLAGCALSRQQGWRGAFSAPDGTSS